MTLEVTFSGLVILPTLLDSLDSSTESTGRALSSRITRAIQTFAARPPQQVFCN
jgi:hypothetical protein